MYIAKLPDGLDVSPGGRLEEMRADDYLWMIHSKGLRLMQATGVEQESVHTAINSNS